MKLTKAQRETLAMACVGRRGITVAPGYKPAQKLVELGLAELVESRWGNPLLVPTEAGRRTDAELRAILEVEKGGSGG